MRLIIIYSTLALFLSCTNKPKTSNAETTQGITKDSKIIGASENKTLHLKDFIIGRWEDSGSAPDVYPKFGMNFSKNNDGNIEAIYFDGGPFEEYLICKFQENNLDLYFDTIGGSISFNQNNKINNSCKVKVATCTILNDSILLIETFDDKCGQIPTQQKLKLTKI